MLNIVHMTVNGKEVELAVDVYKRQGGTYGRQFCIKGPHLLQPGPDTA